MLALTALLAACGGGNEGTSIESISPPPAPAADAMLTQLSTSTVVTPGETFRILGKTSCIVDAVGICAKQVPFGELGIKTSLKLTDVKFFFDGNQMDGVPIKEEGQYRFFPIGYYTVWKPDIALEVMATLASSTASGTTATVVLQGTSGSFDKKLDVVPAPDSKVTVFAQANYAPLVITPETGPDTVRGFRATCDARVAGGCTVQAFSYAVNDGAPNAEMLLYLGDLGWLQVFTDAQGYASGFVQADLRIPPGGSMPVWMSATRFPSVGGERISFGDFVTKSGDKVIAPLLPEACTAVTPQNCKG